MGGSAILDGAKNLLTTIGAAAALQFNCRAEDVTLEDGVAHGPRGRTLSFAAITVATGPLSANGTFANTKRTYSYGAHAAHVSVDPRTGHVKILDYVAVEDVGRAINPALVHGQTFGAVVQGPSAIVWTRNCFNTGCRRLLDAYLRYPVLRRKANFQIFMSMGNAGSPVTRWKPENESGVVGVEAAARAMR